MSEFDASYKNFGLHLSGAGWYDDVYHRDNDNNSPGTANSISVKHDKFTDETKDLHGGDAEILDAFAYYNSNESSIPWSIRVGQHTLMWGESLFLADNGIAYGQAPLDVIKLLGVPGTQAKELFRPIPQVSAQFQPTSRVTVMGFYQWEWDKTQLPAVGSYLSDVDILDEGGERFLGPNFLKADDMEASDSGQWGVAVKYRPTFMDDWEFGVYYYEFNDRLPQLYIYPVAGEYQLVYPEDIKALGVSFATQIGPVNVSGEVHERFDMPLVSTPQVVLPGMKADNNNNSLYAIGDTLHANLSAIYFLNPSFAWGGGTFLGEIAWNKVLDVTENESAQDKSKNEDVFGFRFVFEPAYYQVLPGFDLRVPLSVGYNPRGNSVIDQKFNGGADEGGDVSIGLNVDYLTTWKYSVKYTNFFGSGSTQNLTDRDFVSFSVQHTF